MPYSRASVFDQPDYSSLGSRVDRLSRIAGFSLPLDRVDDSYFAWLSSCVRIAALARVEGARHVDGEGALDLFLLHAKEDLIPSQYLRC